MDTPPLTKRRRQSWTIEQKLFAINTRDQDPKPTLDDISIAFEARFNACASKTTLSNWLQPKSVERVRALAYSEYGKSRRRVRAPTCPKLEAAVYTWVRLEEARVGTLSGEAIFQKAKELALQPELEVPPGFRFSQGWLSRFKSRHGITRSARSQARHSRERVKREPDVRENFTQLLQDSPRGGKSDDASGDLGSGQRASAPPLAIIARDGAGQLVGSQPLARSLGSDPNAPFLTSTPLGLIKTEHATSLMATVSACNSFLGEAAEYLLGGSPKMGLIPGDPASCFMEAQPCVTVSGDPSGSLVSLAPIGAIQAQAVSSMGPNCLDASMSPIPAIQVTPEAILSNLPTSTSLPYPGNPSDSPSA